MSESCAGCLHPLMDHDRGGCELCDCSRPHGRISEGQPAPTFEAYRATISDHAVDRHKTGVVTHEFRNLGMFIFLEDGKTEKRTFDTQWWTIHPEPADPSSTHEHRCPLGHPHPIVKCRCVDCGELFQESAGRDFAQCSTCQGGPVCYCTDTGFPTSPPEGRESS